MGTPRSNKIGNNRHNMSDPDERMCRQIRALVIRIRALKHASGMQVSEICRMFPQIPEAWISDIVWYRIWPCLEFPSPDGAVMSDLLNVGIGPLQSLLHHLGYVKFDEARLLELFKRNRERWGE